MNNNVFYLSSLESKAFNLTRKCTFLKKIYLNTNKQCAIAEIYPPVIGQQFGKNEDIKYVILVNRHEGETLFPIKEFPCFVYITRPLIADIFNKETVAKENLQIIAWGELYKTETDANNHSFR